MHDQCTGKTVKVNCPAKIQMQEVLVFKDYPVQSQMSIKENLEVSNELYNKIAAYNNTSEPALEVPFERRIYVTFPTLMAHANHSVQVSNFLYCNKM